MKILQAKFLGKRDSSEGFEVLYVTIKLMVKQPTS
jgi:hypothetical protein